MPSLFHHLKGDGNFPSGRTYTIQYCNITEPVTLEELRPCSSELQSIKTPIVTLNVLLSTGCEPGPVLNILHVLTLFSLANISLR